MEWEEAGGLSIGAAEGMCEVLSPFVAVFVVIIDDWVGWEVVIVPMERVLVGLRRERLGCIYGDIWG